MRTLCWSPTWNDAKSGVGLEHLVLRDGSAESVVTAFDDDLGPFRLGYRLAWDDTWQLRTAELSVVTPQWERTLSLHTDGKGRWEHHPALDGCIDIDIWPTPFTNSFPILRSRLAVGERREYRMAWVDGLKLTVHAQAQAYTRVGDQAYLFESLDGSGFEAELPVDDHGFVLDYPGLFRRVQ